jgi:putative FmdB family regulatory protein
MPEYDYRCEGCGKRFVARQTFAEHDRAKRIKCPKCGSLKVARVIGTVFAKTAKKS